jgi:hypothetical protein
MEEEKSSYMKCMNCNFRGWTDNYHEEANGVISLFKPGE